MYIGQDWRGVRKIFIDRVDAEEDDWRLESVDLPLHSSPATLHLRSRSRFGFHSSFSTLRILQSSAKDHLNSEESS